MNIKNLKVVAAGLCLGATLLTGCSNKIPYIDSKLMIGNNKVVGNITYEDLDKYVEIIKFEQDGKENVMLCLKYYCDYDHYSVSYTNYTIYDLMSGTILIQYKKNNDKDEVTYSLGESLPLKEELPFTPYLVTEDFIKNEYTVEEVIEFFNEKVKPSLASQEKELVK